ncbi:MAG TPA: protein phosphatase 2C domain-containing protein [Casimicrobiaceae bacterium]|nr:protein phosphatase 2C domain-containing protein [Casimicrobiaceae bacterium]
MSPNEPNPEVVEEVVPPSRVTADVAAYSHVGNVREQNEDSYAIFRMGRFLERVASNVPEEVFTSAREDSAWLYAVADGLGGHSAGEVASRMAMISMMQMILRAPRWALRLDDPTTREADIAALFKRVRGYLHGVHETLKAQAERDKALEGMGTTLTSAYSVGNDLFVVHVGDSRAYLLRGGQIRRITRDHTLAQSYADQGLIPQAEVETHELGHVLTRAMGAGDSRPEHDIHHLDLQDDDRILLCSDGLTRVVPEPELASLMLAFADSPGAARALVDRALAQGGTDNITAIVARYRIR